MGRLDVVVGGQYGSESKGRVAGHIVKAMSRFGNETMNIRVAGPNAGHVVINPDTGTRHALRQVPVGIVTNPNCQALIAAGSEIDLDVLVNEIHSLEADGIKVRTRLKIHEQATILEPSHRETEQAAGMHGSIGSTAKGIGAARADRIMRVASIARDYAEQLQAFGTMVGNDYMAQMAGWIADEDAAYSVVIEGTQGYGLGLHAGHYPQCTSSDCRAIDFCAMAGLNPWDAAEFAVHVVLRAFPIRVAGNSGPLRNETTWEELGLDAERTTVTNKVRRVGYWDADLAAAAVRANGNPRIVQVSLAMLDQMHPEIANTTTMVDMLLAAKEAGIYSTVMSTIEAMQSDAGARITTIGTGPNHTVEFGFAEVMRMELTGAAEDFTREELRKLAEVTSAPLRALGVGIDLDGWDMLS